MNNLGTGSHYDFAILLSDTFLENFLADLYKTSGEQSLGEVDVLLAIHTLIIHMVEKTWVGFWGISVISCSCYLC